MRSNAVAAATFSLVALLAPAAALATAPAPRPNGELLLKEAWQHVKKNFYDKRLHGVDWDAAFEKYRDQARDAESPEDAHLAVNRMLGELGASHTVLMERDTYELLDAELMGQDVLQTGVQLEWRDTGFFVRTMFERGPGEKAGLRIGDRIVSVDGEKPEDSERLVTAIHDVRFRGEPIFFIVADGERPVRLVVQRTPSPASRFETRLRPEKTGAVRVARESVTVEEVDGFRIGRIHLWYFPMGKFLDVITEALMGPLQGCDGLILDMRGRGGYEHVGWAIIQLLRSGAAKFDGEIVALIDEQTRSAKEVFSYRFREAKVGTLVGRKTPGSVLGAVFRTLSDGSVLMIGGKDVRVGRGVKLEGRGVAPDVLVEEHFPDYANGFDPIYEKGLEVVLEKCRARERRSSRGRAVLFEEAPRAAVAAPIY